MLKEISALEIKHLLKEIKILVNGKVDKIYQPEKDQVILQVHVTGEGKKLLKVVSGKFLCLSSSKSSSAQPKGFCMALRKYLGNARIKDIKQVGFERIVELKLETKEDKFSLFLEFFDKGNIILVKDKLILSVLQQQKWKDRNLMAREEYKYPKREYDTSKIDEATMKNVLKNSSQEKIVKTLAVDLGLGGVYAEEVCLISDINKNEKPQTKFAPKLVSGLKKVLSSRVNAVAYSKNGQLKNVTPFPLKQYEKLEKEEFDSFSSAIDNKIVVEKEEETTYDKEIKKIEKIIQKQEKQIHEMEQKAEDNKEKGERVYEKYQLVEEISNELKEAKKKYSIKEMREKLKGHNVVKEINNKGEVILEL